MKLLDLYALWADWSCRELFWLKLKVGIGIILLTLILSVFLQGIDFVWKFTFVRKK